MISDLLYKMKNKELLSDSELNKVLAEMDAAGDRDKKKNDGKIIVKESEMFAIWFLAWNNEKNGFALYKKVVKLLESRACQPAKGGNNGNDN